MTNLPKPTNGMDRADMNDILLRHAWELSSAMANMPDMAGSDLHQQVVALVEKLRDEARAESYWLKSA